MSGFSYKRNALYVDDRRVATFEYPIMMILESGKRAIVLLDVFVPGSKMTRNVFCVDADGTMLWQVSARDDRAEDSVEGDACTNVWAADDGIGACTWGGWEIRIDESTGEARTVRWSK